MKIRDATGGDRGRIERIARTSFDRLYAYFALRGIRRTWPLLVAEEGDAIVGFLEGQFFAGEPPIGNVYYVAVDPTDRKKGIGHALVEEALRRFRERGATRVFAAVTRDNESSMNLFAALGFAEISRRMLWRWYRWRGLAVRIRMVMAPHEALLMRTFTDPSPASAQGL